MFRGLFKGNKDKDEYFEQVDPVVEQRRKEKFSTPLIYDDFEEEEKVVKPKKEVKKPKKVAVEKPIEVEIPKAGYQPIEVISPMRGYTGSKVKKTPVTPVKKKVKKRKLDDQLMPVISPYFGSFDKEEEIEIEDAVLQSVEDPKEEVIEEVPTVEENLRNIAKIVEEEQNQLKIIEERTGEFKLDFSEAEKEKTTLIDEIDDDMSLDELMSLYEKKFTD